jgi:hypothetical protein
LETPSIQAAKTSNKSKKRQPTTTEAANVAVCQATTPKDLQPITVKANSVFLAVVFDGIIKQVFR